MMAPDICKKANQFRMRRDVLTHALTMSAPEILKRPFPVTAD